MAKGKYKEWLEPEGLLLIEGWARDGLTEEQIAHNMGIAVSTLNNWKNAYMEIVEALKKGKEVVDLEVENALLKKALGYRYTETKTKTGPDGTEVTISEKEIVPDTTAQIFWLKNRRPDKWRDKQQVTADINQSDSIKDFLKAVSPSKKELKEIFEGEDGKKETE